MLAPRHAILLTVFAMLCLAMVMVHSAQMRVDADAPLVSVRSMLTSRHAAYAGVAMVMMLIASRIDLRQTLARGGGGVVLVTLLVAIGLNVATLLPGVGKAVNGAHRWLALGPISFQPSELLKWTLVTVVAWYAARSGEGLRRFFSSRGLLPVAMVVGLACGLVVIEDLGTGALIAAAVWLILWIGGARLVHLLAPAVAGVALFAVAILMRPYRLARITAFLDPWADPMGTGYHPIQSMLAIAQGGLFGRGLGHGIQKFGYLPEDTTDFIFAIICEELGLAGALLVVGMFCVLGMACWRIGRQSSDRFVALFAWGVMFTLLMQAAMNIAVVTVVVPTKGIALPLISSGGTGWIVTAFALGLVAGLDPRPTVATHTAPADATPPFVPCELDEEPAGS